MAKKKEEKVQLFYANADKLNRARQTAKKASDVKKEYENLGGVFHEGYGVEPV